MLFRAIMRTLRDVIYIVGTLALLAALFCGSIKFVDAFGFIWWVAMMVVFILVGATYENYQDEKKRSKKL